eukprot:TRINITY_DN7934_c0_g1_i1.p1 TRINITY_DN7934_c0_g1~~TRINITY_DN7934_c0_g1_i1.p1  ORF type:complete len:370 (+),score=50.70 TRINITY_DN7934_c0_g1_i1:54-1163(+)
MFGLVQFDAFQASITSLERCTNLRAKTENTVGNEMCPPSQSHHINPEAVLRYVQPYQASGKRKRENVNTESIETYPTTKRICIINDNDKKHKSKDPSETVDKARRSREASRRYRQKKKALMEQMKEEICTLQNRNQKLQSERGELHGRIQSLESQLHSENKRMLTAQIVERKRLHLLKELELLMAQNPSDEQLQPLLDKLIPYCKRINDIGNDMMARFLDKETTVHIAHYFGSDRLHKDSLVHSFDNFVSKVTSTVPNLTAEQANHMWEMAREYKPKLQGLLRMRIMHSSTLAAAETNEDSPGFSASVEGIRKSFVEEANLTLQYMGKCNSVLKPKQLGIFFLQVSFVHRCVEQIKDVWASLYGSDLVK